MFKKNIAKIGTWREDHPGFVCTLMLADLIIGTIGVTCVGRHNKTAAASFAFIILSWIFSEIPSEWDLKYDTLIFKEE